MSEQPTDTTQEPEAFVLGDDPAAQMGALLGFLAPEEDAPAAAEGAAAGDAAAAEPGQQPAPGEGAGAGAPDGGEPADGDAGQPAVPDGGSGQPDGAGATATVEPGPGAGAVDATTLTEKWGEVAQAFETNQLEHLQQSALEEVRGEHEKYFEALQKHPRLLVGETVPSAKGTGTETLRDAQDARDWQEAIKHLLVAEVEARTAAKADEYREVFTTVHSSIDLFRNNPDLIPGTKQFDRELADQFAALAKDYELRSNGKLVGYSVPVQPMIGQLRAQLAARKAAAAAPAAAAAAPSPQAQRAAEQPRTPTGQWEGPQGGFTSKAGQSSDHDDVAAGVYGAFLRQNGITI